MTTWIEAYKARLERNHKTILDEAVKLKALGCKVYVSRADRLISAILIRKDGKHCFFGFAEVPYRWYVSVSWKPNAETGSGRTVLTKYDSESQPITIEEMFAAMISDYPKFDRDHSFYNELDDEAIHTFRT